MSQKTRRKLILLDTIIVFIVMTIEAILGILLVRFLLERFGDEVNGLLQTGNQLLSYLQLLEGGIGAAYVYSLYKPMAENDYKSASSLYVGYCNSLRKAIIKMLVVAIIISLTYPLLLKSNGISYWFMASVFLLQSSTKIIPYFVSLVPQNMIIVKERRFIVSIVNGLCSIIIYLIEFILLCFTVSSLQVILFIGILISIIFGLILRLIMKRMYKKMLNLNACPDYSPNKMSKDVVITNVSSMVFNSTDNIVISVLDSLSSVTYYTNYNRIVNFVTTLVSSVIRGSSATFGLKIASRDNNTYSVFREIYMGILFIGAIICIVFITMINEFIEICFGGEYCLSLVNVMLFAYIMYSSIIFQLLSTINSSAGLFKERKKFTLLQMIINLLITIALVPVLGITGALLGTLIARVFVTIPMNYKIMYKYVFVNNKTKNFELVLIILFSFMCALLCIRINRLTCFQSILGIRGFIIRTLISTFVSFCTIGLFMSLLSDDFRKCLKRTIKHVF